MTKNLSECYTCKKKPAVTYRRIDGRYLCKECFSKWVSSIVRKTVSKKKLFERNDRIIVGLSGGKDSTVLLDILHKIERKYPSELIAVCIDEGIANYREDGLPIAEKIAKNLDVEFHLFSLTNSIRKSSIIGFAKSFMHACLAMFSASSAGTSPSCNSINLPIRTSSI